MRANEPPLSSCWLLCSAHTYPTDATIYKNKDDGIKKYMFRTTAESAAGIPFKFHLELAQDAEFEREKTRNNKDTIEFLELSNNEGGNAVEYTSFKLPPGLKNRDFCVMKAERSSADGSGPYEAVMRSTEHPSKPIEYSSEDKVNNPEGKKRAFIRAYQFVYMCMESQDDGAWGQSRGIIALDMRGEFSPKIMDSLLSDQIASDAKETRQELLRRMAAAGYSPVPPEKFKWSKKKK